MKLSQKKREWLFGYLFVGSWIVGFILFTLVPVGQSFYYSLTNYAVTADGLTGSYIGPQNYLDAFLKDISYVEALIAYFSNMIVTLVAVIVFSVIIAIILNKDFPLRGFWRTVFFLPVIISSGPVISKLTNEGATSILMSTDSVGLLSVFQSNLPEFLTNAINTIFGKIVIILWFTGVPVLIFLAGLQKINTNIYEAARVDGASKWEIFWKIVLPSLKPLININVIYTVVSLSLFSNNHVMYLIDIKKLNRYGYANALTWIYFGLTVIFLLIFLFILNFRELTHRKTKEIKMYRDEPMKVGEY